VPQNFDDLLASMIKTLTAHKDGNVASRGSDGKVRKDKDDKEIKCSCLPQK
jgi:hypothetical protein